MKFLTKHSILQISLQLVLAMCCLLTPLHGQADVNSIKIHNLANPLYSNAIHMGDVLERSIEVEVNSAYQLPKTSLPIKGESRNGIELRDISVKTTKISDSVIYKISLSYQVFTSAAKPVVMQLPEERFPLTGGPKSLTIDVPVWRFWYSPLVAEGIKNAEAQMQPQAKPPLIQSFWYYIVLSVALSLLVIGILGLIYVNADKPWLPWMNGAFSRAHRKIKQLRNEQASYRHALIHIHQAFNSIYGENLFANELDKFFVAHPKFMKMQGEIIQFFAQSNAVLFGQDVSSSNDLQHLKVLSKRFRDCERGV
jgi:mxaA protein